MKLAAAGLAAATLSVEAHAQRPSPRPAVVVSVSVVPATRPDSAVIAGAIRRGVLADSLLDLVERTEPITQPVRGAHFYVQAAARVVNGQTVVVLTTFNTETSEASARDTVTGARADIASLLADAASRLVRRLLAAPVVPRGYTRADPVRLPETLTEVHGGGNFRISIQRTAQDHAERRLIALAESLIPPADSILKHTQVLTGRGHEMAEQLAAERPGNRWWWRQWYGVWFPFALTGHAVAECVGQVRGLASGPNPFAQHNPGVQHTAFVEYSAKVLTSSIRPPRPEVHLQIRFRFLCGSRCGVTFEHSRVVAFDNAGGVVRVVGDGPPASAFIH